MFSERDRRDADPAPSQPSSSRVTPADPLAGAEIRAERPTSLYGEWKLRGEIDRNRDVVASLYIPSKFASGTFHSVVFSPDGGAIAMANHDGYARVVSADQRDSSGQAKQIARFSCGSGLSMHSYPKNVEFAPDCSRLMVQIAGGVYGEDTLEISSLNRRGWLGGPKCLARYQPSHDKFNISASALDSSGMLMAAALGDGGIKLLSVHGTTRDRSLSGAPAELGTIDGGSYATAMRFTPDDSRLLVVDYKISSQNGGCRLRVLSLEAKSGGFLDVTEESSLAFDSHISDFAISRDGSSMAIGFSKVEHVPLSGEYFYETREHWTGEVQLFSLKRDDGRLQLTPGAKAILSEPIESVDFNRDATLLAVGSGEQNGWSGQGRATVFSTIETGSAGQLEEIASFTANGAVTAVAFNPKGDKLAVGAYSGQKSDTELLVLGTR